MDLLNLSLRQMAGESFSTLTSPNLYYSAPHSIYDVFSPHFSMFVNKSS